MRLLLGGADARIPISVLTGFLGSGKTTVLNRLVRNPAMSRALVVINEFGAVGLDHDLIARSDEDLVVEMMGGCLCCTIRGDLVRTLRDAPFRFARDGKCWFDRLVIETTGLADPAPILHTLMTDPHLESLYRLDGVITTVDAVNGMATLDAQEESVKQAAVADRLLLTKTDMASGPEIRALEKRLHALNPGAPIVHAIDGMVEAERLFNAGVYNPETKSDDVQRWLNAEAYEISDLSHYGEDHDLHSGHAHHHEHDHHNDVNRHDDRIRAICLTFDAPLEDDAFDRWIGILMSFKGPDVLRIKGIVNIEGLDKPLVIHGVQHVLHLPVMLDAWPSEDRRTRMVLIVRDMDEADLRSTLTLMTQGVENSRWKAPRDSFGAENGAPVLRLSSFRFIVANDSQEQGGAVRKGLTMTRHFSRPARDVIPTPTILVEAVRCWREARDNGGPVQPSLFALLSRNGHDMLAPVIDSLLSLAETVSGRRIVIGDGACLSEDERRLLSLVDGAASEPVDSGITLAFDYAVRSMRLLLTRTASVAGSGFQAAV